MRLALDPAGHRVPRTKPTCLLHTWRPHRRRPFVLVLHLHQHQSSRNLHLQYLAKNQSIHIVNHSSHQEATIHRSLNHTWSSAGRGQRQYDVEMAEQRRVPSFAWEGRACAPLLNLTHLGWTAAASSTGARRSAVRRNRRWLRCRKRMDSNFSILQRRL
jgi:hypothetical protein